MIIQFFFIRNLFEILGWLLCSRKRLFNVGIKDVQLTNIKNFTPILVICQAQLNRKIFLYRYFFDNKDELTHQTKSIQTTRQIPQQTNFNKLDTGRYWFQSNFIRIKYEEKEFCSYKIRLLVRVWVSLYLLYLLLLPQKYVQEIGIYQNQSMN